MEGTIELHFVPTDQQLADIFTQTSGRSSVYQTGE